jgi:glycosyltransferase involved in cell wall biosynthesis
LERTNQVINNSALFVGITSWNSELFLGHCIDAIKRTTNPESTRIVVLDNESVDNSRALAERRGVEVISRKCNQAQALSYLFNLSRSEYTLLIHSDVILLSREWLGLCASHLTGNVAMLSPEDIGCGPYTRTWGGGMPESSFMLFRTDLARKARRWFRVQRFKIRWPYRAMDFCGDHITYNVPSMLAEKGLSWKMMNVHTSTKESLPIYVPNFQPKHWSDAWGLYRYGLGNFYSIDGHVTHYHNWFDRTVREGSDAIGESKATYPGDGGVPLAFIKTYTERFLSDFKSGVLVVPEVAQEAARSPASEAVSL